MNGDNFPGALEYYRMYHTHIVYDKGLRINGTGETSSLDKALASHRLGLGGFSGINNYNKKYFCQFGSPRWILYFHARTACV